MITVFTPTYNRAYCIRNVYESLIKQTYRDFEWLVINDGSIDNTDEVINNCINENKINIRYYKQENGGQHRALNKAIELAKGYMLMIVDSDDDLTNDALEYIVKYESTILNKEDYAGVSGLRCYRDGKKIGTPWPDEKQEYIDATGIERYKKKIMLGDKAEAYYLDVLKKYYPIPSFEGENDVEKGVLWNRIGAAGLKIRWFNKAIYNCEYLSDGMSKNIINNYIKNINGYLLYINEFIHYDIGFIRKIKTIIVTCEIARRKKINIMKLSKKININPILLFPLYICSYISIFRYPIRQFKRKFS